jgi:hypothetical protein
VLQEYEASARDFTTPLLALIIFRNHPYNGNSKHGMNREHMINMIFEVSTAVII